VTFQALLDGAVFGEVTETFLVVDGKDSVAQYVCYLLY